MILGWAGYLVVNVTGLHHRFLNKQKNVLSFTEQKRMGENLVNE